MLRLEDSQSGGGATPQSQVNFVPQLDLLSLLRIVTRRWPVIAASVGVVVVLALFYLMAASNRYNASVLVLVDDNKDTIITRQDAAISKIPDPGLIESQVEIIKSDNVARAVVRKLNLTSDQAFMNQNATVVSQSIGAVVGLVKSLFVSAESGISESSRERTAIDILTPDIKAKRIGMSYVIEVDYRGSDPVRTAKIANAIADAYITGEMDARYDQSKRAAQWLEDRLVELRERTSAADLAVQRYKADHNIVDTSRGLMSEQQLTDVNGQLITARAATAEAKARFDRIAEISKDNFADASVEDALRSEVITRLRAQYLDLSSRKSEIAHRYGPDHSAVLKLDGEMNAISQSVEQELHRIAESTRSDYMIAAAREASLRASLNALVSQADNANQSQVALRNLESAAQANRNMYDSFLQKLGQSTQEQTVPVTSARVITPAAVPERPSWPKPTIVLGIALIVGAVLGFAIALLRETFSTGFRSPEDVREFTGLEYLGTLPKVSGRAPPAGDQDSDVLGAGNMIARQSVLAPFSRFTETVRNVKVSIDLERQPGVSPIIGIISALPKEGKSTVSANLALLTARMGVRTLLIDGDFHNPSLTRTLAPNAEGGLLSTLQGRSTQQSVIKRDSVSGLDFLPAGVRERTPNATSLLSSQEMANLLAAAREHYDYIYIDLPPLLPVVDAKAAAHLIDSFVFVVEWDATTRDAVREALMEAEHVRHQTLGVVLNKADESMLKRIEAYRGPAYGNYYVDAPSA